MKLMIKHRMSHVTDATAALRQSFKDSTCVTLLRCWIFLAKDPPTSAFNWLHWFRLAVDVRNRAHEGQNREGQLFLLGIGFGQLPLF